MSLAWKNGGDADYEDRASPRCMCLYVNTERFLDITRSIQGEMCIEAHLPGRDFLQCFMHTVSGGKPGNLIW